MTSSIRAEVKRDIPEGFEDLFSNAGYSSKRQLALKAKIPVMTAYRFFSEDKTHRPFKTAKELAKACGWTLQEYLDLARILTPEALGAAIKSRIKEQKTTMWQTGKIFSDQATIYRHATGSIKLAHLAIYYAISSALQITLDQLYERLLSNGMIDKPLIIGKLSSVAEQDSVDAESIISQNLRYISDIPQESYFLAA